MALLKTVLLLLFIMASMVLLTPVGVIVFVFSIAGFRKPMAAFMYRVAQGWGRFVIFCTGCTLTVTGREHIPLAGGVCFVSNHGSVFDIALHLAYAGRPVGFIAKKELAYVPFLNMWIYLLGGFFLDRSSPRRAVKTINAGIKRIKAGDAIIIFPEGHRSRGQGLLPFHPGALKLATQAEVPIVPVALSGSYDVFERRYRLTPVPVKVSFGAPIPTAGLLPEEKRQILADRVYAVIKENLA